MAVELGKFINYGVQLGAKYIDLRMEYYASEVVEAEDGKPKEAASSTECGVGVRALAGGSWGFSAARVEGENPGKTVKKVVEEAVKLAKAVKTSKTVNLAPTKIVRDRIIYPVRVEPSDISLEEKMRVCVDASARSLGANGSVKKASAGIVFLNIDKTFLSSEGAEIQQAQTITLCSLFAQAIKGDVSEFYADTFGGLGGYELIQSHNLPERAECAGRKAAILAGAKPTPTGKTTVILDQEFCSLLTHEILGHPSEADRVMGKEAAWAGRTWWREKVGEKIFSEELTVVSDATLNSYLGSFRYDDEGVPSRRIVHVEKGVLRDFLHSRETAAAFNVEPNGAMRASSYLFAPLIRMTNTYIDRGSWRFEEMISEVKEGIYLKGGKTPSIDSRRYNFQISAKEAFAIRDGEIAYPLRSPTLMGVAPEFLSSIDAIGEDLIIFPVPNCGKGDPMQTMRVGNGGPHIRGRGIVAGPR
jgi:TldD protein